MTSDASTNERYQYLDVDEFSYDVLLTRLNSFGKFQAKLFFIVGLVAFFSTNVAYESVFSQGDTGFHCRVPELDQTKFENVTFDDKLALAYPLDPGSMDKLSQCSLYDPNDYHKYTIEQLNHLKNRSIFDCSNERGWWFDRSMLTESLTMKMQLVCKENKWIATLTTSLLFVGYMLGAFIFGQLSDKYGRKLTLFFTVCSYAIVQASQMFVNGRIFYMASTVLRGIFGVAFFLCLFVLACELGNSKWRSFVGLCTGAWFGLGIMTSSGVAYLLPNWLDYHLFWTIMGSLIMLLYFFIPESPSWLISQGRIDEATVILRKIAKDNGREIPEETAIQLSDMKPGGSVNNIGRKAANGVGSKAGNSATLIDVFKNRNLCLRALNMSWNFCAVAMVYFGLSLNVGNLSGDLIWNNAISGAVEIPANIIALICLNLMGRRTTLIGSWAMCAAGCLSSAFIPRELSWLQVVLSMAGKTGATMSYTIVYVYSAELYPTPTRAVAMGFNNVFSRIGGIISPYIALLNSIWHPLPMLVFGGCAVSAGILTCFLPETKDQPLPQTIQEIEMKGRK